MGEIIRIQKNVAKHFFNFFSKVPQTKAEKELKIINKIHFEARTLLNGYDRWKNNEELGLRYFNAIHELREEVGTSGEEELLAKIDDNLKHINIVEYNLQSIINDVTKFLSFIDGFKVEQEALPGVKDNDPLLKRLASMDIFCKKLVQLYEKDLKIKRRVIQGISYTVSSDDSYILMASWDCQSSSNELSALIVQLQVADPNLCWDL